MCSEKSDNEHDNTELLSFKDRDIEISETDVTTDSTTSQFNDELVSSSPSTVLTTIQEDTAGLPYKFFLRIHRKT